MKLLQNSLTRGFLLLALFALTGNFALAQRTVKGKVTDAETGEGLIQATVSVVGTPRGATTDLDGNYSIAIPNGATQLRFSYTGYAEQTITLGASNTVDIALAPSAVLEETVVIGYGAVRKVDATGAVSSVTEKNFNRGAISSPEQLMQGRVSGVQITQNNGEPGGGINVRIRGTSSVRSGNNPLFVVDGVPLSGDETSSGGFQAGFSANSARNPLSFLNPADIASIDVLKDASATAIYGSRGANGVVIITTKTGAGGKGSLSYDYTLGFSTIAKRFDLLDPTEFLAAYSDFNGPDQARLLDGGAKTDWQDEMFQTGIMHQHNVSFGGGDQSSNYRFAFGFMNQGGIVIETGLKRYNARFNGSKKFLNDRLKINTQITISNQHDDNPQIGNTVGYEGDAIGGVLKSNPTLPVFNADGTYWQRPNGDISEPNPIAMVGLSRDFTNTLRGLGNISAEVTIAEGLTFKSVLGVDRSMSSRKAAFAKNLQVQTIYGKGRAFMADRQIDNHTWENYFTYAKNFGNVNFTGIAGYSYQTFDNSGFQMESSKFQTESLDLMINNIASGGSNVVTNTYNTSDELQSYYARLNFGISEKYLFTATVRADGSTKFGGDNKYGIFPSFSAKWRLGQEAFMPESMRGLGLRVGYGITGNQELPHNQYQQRQRYGDYDLNDAGDVTGGGIGDVAFANPSLKWESTKQLNVGVDFDIIEGKLTGSIDFYDKHTTDLLLQVESAQPAPRPYVWKNLDADVQNTGIDIQLNIALVKKDNFSWDMTLTPSFNKNIVNNFNGLINTGEINGQGLTGAFAQRIAGDQPLYAFFVRKFGGYDDNGITIYEDGDFQQFVGSPHPKVYGGWANNFRFGRFDATLFLNSSFGNKIYNNTANAYFTAGALANGRNATHVVVGNGEARLNAPDVSTRFLEDGSFVRISNLSVGYNVPVKNKNISGLRLSLVGQNLYCFTNYSGQDPEINVSKPINGVPSLGIDYTTYPRARTILVAASVTF